MGWNYTCRSSPEPGLETTVFSPQASQHHKPVSAVDLPLPQPESECSLNVCICIPRCSQMRLWALQLIMVSTPSLLVALHVAYREHRESKHGRKLYEDKGRIDGGLLCTYLLSLVLKTAFEVGTLLTFYILYDFNVPRLLRCEESPCPNTVDCYISKPTEKKVFLYIMACTSILCIVLNVTEMLYIMSKQCWKCFSKRYIPVDHKGACRCHPPATLILGSPGLKPESVSKEMIQFQSTPTLKEPT
uniref:Gap junction protein n=1 Tax=Pygocentrus nattereri TaxID=42514 RepID=A0AAR2JE37_PYGNA